MNIDDVTKVLNAEPKHENQEDLQFSIFENGDTYCIGHRGISKWVAFIDEDPWIDDQFIDCSKLEKYNSSFMKNKGSFAVCWTPQQVLQFIYNTPGKYITRYEYLHHGAISYA